MQTTTLPFPWSVRALAPQDLNSLLQIQSICYGNSFLESRDVFAQRLSCPHHCSLGVVREGDHALHAYLAAYWSSPGKITPLNGYFTAPSPGPQVAYLHDMSVLPALSGQGVARHLVQSLLATARRRGIRQAALVSVQGSENYWKRQGFSASPLSDPEQIANLETYGSGALYMTMAL